MRQHVSYGIEHYALLSHILSVLAAEHNICKAAYEFMVISVWQRTHTRTTHTNRAHTKTQFPSGLISSQLLSGDI